MAVLNKHRDHIPPGAIYIGRGSQWGNPYSHLSNTTAKHRVATRDEAVDRYEEDLRLACTTGTRADIQALADLHGKDLVCFCAPQRCHGHVLETYAAHAFKWIQENPDVPGIGE